jgi:hypothetical protein
VAEEEASRNHRPPQPRPIMDPLEKGEWAPELQPFPSGLEAVTSGGQRCALGLEDWESMLSETARVAEPRIGAFTAALEPIGGVSGTGNLITSINQS